MSKIELKNDFFSQIIQIVSFSWQIKARKKINDICCSLVPFIIQKRLFSHNSTGLLIKIQSLTQKLVMGEAESWIYLQVTEIAEKFLI